MSESKVLQRRTETLIEDSSNNAYLVLRQAKIARNEARLKELGLVVPACQSLSTKRTKSQAAKSTDSSVATSSTLGGRSPANQVSDVATSKEIIPPQPRRSKRLLSVEQEHATATAQKGEQKRQLLTSSRRPRRHNSCTINPSPPPAAAPSTNSARGIQIDTRRVLDHFIGRVLPQMGKAAVMNEVARVASLYPSSSNQPVSFNKYSGVQEWADNSFFLWINFGVPNADVVNTFLDDGRQVIWFGGSRMCCETPVIQKLLAFGKSCSLEDIDGNLGAVILWCRQFNVEQKVLQPYTCLGRLKLVEFFPKSRPLKFVWELLDYELLLSHSWGQFRELVQSNSGPTPDLLRSEILDLSCPALRI